MDTDKTLKKGKQTSKSPQFSKAVYKADSKPVSKPAKKRSSEHSFGLEQSQFSRPQTTPNISSIEVIAGLLSLIWLGAVLYVFVKLQPKIDSNPVDFVTTLLSVFLPVALIWVAASAAKTSRIMREESARLQIAIDAMRRAYVEQQKNAGAQMRASVEDKLAAISRAQERAEAAIHGLTSAAPEQAENTEITSTSRSAARPTLTSELTDTQPSLALGTPAETLADEEEPLSMGDFIRSINFPENEKDKEGFRTLRRALRDPKTSKLIKAAQDVLTLLSQDGIYMDDLLPDRAKPDIWRRFADGERGRVIAALGGVRDRSSLALAAGRMKSDPVFRDAALHFLRQFDLVTSEIIPRATDLEVSKLANTRTSRAFMLLARVTGTFD